MNKVIVVQNLNKSFLVGQTEVEILHSINFELEQGDFGVIFGPSGCGKSTLLHTLLGLEPPTSGTVSILDTNLYRTMSEDAASSFRKTHLGMVYQQPNWIKALSVIENVAFPLQLLGIERGERLDKAIAMLKLVGMEERKDYQPSELSSGQQQKVALGRALITDPEIIIADEPTGNLDYESGQTLMQLLTHFNRDLGKTILMVTHDLEYAKYGKTAFQMFDGKIIETYRGAATKNILKSQKTKRGT